jgi:hypothetical protein
VAAVPLQRAFDLTPGYELRLGPKAHPVPPLTLGRFMDLMACDWSLLATALKAVQTPATDEAPAKDDPEKLAAQVGKSLAYFPTEAFAPLIASVVPGVTEAEWKEHGSGTEFMFLYRYFGMTHDWFLIRKAIGFGDPKAAPATRSTVTAALLSFCQRFPSESLAGLLSMRVEGFFYMRDGAAELMGAEQDEEGDSLPPGGAILQDPEKKNSIWAAIDKAQVQ